MAWSKISGSFAARLRQQAFDGVATLDRLVVHKVQDRHLPQQGAIAQRMPQEAGGDDVDLFLPLAQGGTGFAMTAPADPAVALDTGPADHGLTFSLEPNEPEAPVAAVPDADAASLPDLADDVLSFRNTKA